MLSRISGTTDIRKKALLAAGILIALLVGCDRKVEQVPTVTRPANAFDHPGTTQAEDDPTEVKATLDLVPFLGAATAQFINGETWLKYACGLMMQEERQGKGDSIKTGQYAHVAYKGTFPGSSSIFDQADKDHPFAFQLGSKNIIKGWNLALSTMSIGCKRRYYIPAYLAYGAHGSLPTIAPNQPLIFEIELLDITGVQTYLPPPSIALGSDLTKFLIPILPLGDPVSTQTPDGQTWQKYPGGMMLQQLKPGTGDQAKLGQMAEVTYVGMLAKDKSVFDQKSKDDPFNFQVGSKDVIKGWNYAVSTMTEGEKLRIYLPPDLAYGEKGDPPKIGPNEPLIFEIELMRVTGDAFQWPASAKEPDTALAPAVAGPTTAPATQP